MSITRCRWALAFTFISLVAAAAPDNPPAATADQLELALAKTRDLYLRIDPPGRVLEIKARGLTLDTLPLAGFALVGHHEPGTAGPPVPVELPAVWTVETDLAAGQRRLIAPAELVPYSEDAVAPERQDPKGPAAEAHELLPPATYQVGLDHGWLLLVGQKSFTTGAWSRFRQALTEGWERLHGKTSMRPNLLVLTLEPDDARRLHHVFRADLRLLLTADQLGSPAPAPP